MKKQLYTRYLVFIGGILLSSFAVALVTKASLGTSPISSVPYVLSLGFAPTIGTFTVAFNFLLMLVQLLLLRRRFRPLDVLQMPFTLLFGYAIDWSLLLLNFEEPSSYLIQLLMLFIGCGLLSFGIYMQVCANILLLPGEATVRAIAVVANKEFAEIKPWFDLGSVALSLVISLICFGGIVGLREGTLISALIVGRLVSLCNRYFPGLRLLCAPRRETADSAT